MMSAGAIDIKRCLGLIKQLQVTNQLLTREKNEALQSKSQSEQKLQELQQRYDELSSKFENYANSSVGQFVPEEDDFDENIPSEQNHVSDNDHVKKLEELLEQKEKEIVSLQQTLQDLNQENAQMSRLKTFLQETKSISSAFVAQMDKLQSRLDGFGDGCQETTHPQAVSGDQDVTTPGADHQNSLQKELEQVKAENEHLLSRLQPLQNAEAERDLMVALKNNLEEENKQLQTQISILSTAKAADFPIESQLKVFLDDFQDERKEKEQQYCEKQKILEENQQLVTENQRLKEKLEASAAGMTDLQHQMVDWSPPHQPPKQTPPSNHPQPTNVSYERGHSRLDYPHSPMDYPQFYGASNTPVYYNEHTTVQPSAYHGGPAPLTFTPPPNEPHRRIGFPPNDVPLQTRLPTSPPTRTNHPNVFPQRGRPPLVTRQYAVGPRPQFSPAPYTQGRIESDNSASSSAFSKGLDSTR